MSLCEMPSNGHEFNSREVEKMRYWIFLFRAWDEIIGAIDIAQVFTLCSKPELGYSTTTVIFYYPLSTIELKCSSFDLPSDLWHRHRLLFAYLNSTNIIVSALVTMLPRTSLFVQYFLCLYYDGINHRANSLSCLLFKDKSSVVFLLVQKNTYAYSYRL